MSSTTKVPLSTVFTAPASCSTSWTYEAKIYNGITSGILLQNALNDYLDTDCFPPGFANAGRGPASQIFSPGACPDGYSTQLNSISGNVTTATCCSRHFTYTNQNEASGCLSTYQGATILTARAGGFNSTDTTTDTSISGSFTMWGMPIIVAVQSSQLALYTTSTSMIPSSTSTPTETASPSTNRLSTGAKAGIAVGVVLSVLFLLTIGWLFWRHRRKSLETRYDPTGPLSPTAVGGTLYQDGSAYQAETLEMLAQKEREVTQPSELSSGHQLVELGTS